MTLRECQDPTDPSTLRHGVQEDFVIFYASRDECGNLWCPDCVAVESRVKNAFGRDDGRSAVIVYVGQRPEWKSLSNPFRADPWKVESIPTIIKVRDGARLVDKDIEHSLASFLE
ncbi:hypothetical protein POSPLADRAFT_1128913 [Postia placenta MAD-698-R-SB12]|uniref:Thioredoxin domain-containing protein n=1 Tax=Postia placenta MAD-698-R-SB12 TaxID=670580 RepID=A0A1X6NET9_9APHY|nr:hypothetical protein POSPLADRAFT_1128913 [Postia placenta MAD-698-R-SB12]OSX67104.1 hypothetical protein POSPLADRAFT_1128913 [Postia placenta MAD-698-R-SB12]